MTQKDILFLILDNINKGIKFVVDPEDRIQFAHLNLQGIVCFLTCLIIDNRDINSKRLFCEFSIAGKKAISISSFHSAANYLRIGIGLLNKQSWVSHYDLTIKLYDAALEAYYATGQFSAFELTAKQPLIHAKCFGDKLNAYLNQVRYLTALERGDEALATCLTVLETLGEEIPRQSSNSTLKEEGLVVRNLLQKSVSRDLLKFPLLEDPKKIVSWIMQTHFYRNFMKILMYGFA